MKADIKSQNDYWITTDISKLDFESIHNWITNSYWANGRTKEVMKKVMDNSLNFGLFCNDNQVGFARVVTDYHTFAYLCDVIIDDSYRGKGLGKKLMKEVLEYPDLKTMKRWLLFTKDAHGLYRQFGFGKDETPDTTMIKKNPEVC
jgi:GNAT superfamily N-acetyltransferase